MKKTVLRIFVLVMAAAVAFTVVHFAVLGNNSPADTAFTFAIEDGSAILTGSTDELSGAVVLPRTIEGYPVVGIGENAFKDCADVTAFFLPDSLTSIGAYAFENCTGLVQAVLPAGLTKIGEGAFWNCSGLVSVTVPASVTSIGSCAFYKCGLESLIVAGTSTSVKGAFNVALDIGQTLAIRNPARYTLDPIDTTVYCYRNSAAHYDLLQDAFAAYVLLDDCVLTSYTVNYVDTTGSDVAVPFTLAGQPAGVHVAAVATVPENTELCYPDPGTQTIELTGAAADNMITFVYTGRTYTITFDTDGGDTKAALVYATTDTTALGAATRFGYELTGWKVSTASTDTHYNWGDVDTLYVPTDVVTDMYGDVTLKAVWKAVGVTVTFDAQGGTADAQNKLVEFAGTYGELPGASREGYTFDGWYTSEGVRIESSTTVTTVDAQTLYAHWTINKYDVTVTTDGNGTAAADLTADVEYGTTVTLTFEPNTGFAFAGWETEDVTIADNAFTMPDKAVSVKATFTPIEYTITFDAAGGEAKEPLTYVITDTTTLGKPTRTGYTFLGWKPTASVGSWLAAKTYQTTETVNGKYGSVTLAAQWLANYITVTYDGQGGTPTAESKNIQVGGTYGTLAAAAREGYTFAGWYSSPEGGSKIEATTSVTATEDHTIYARWTINKYNITLTTDGNGFVNADATNDVEYGTTVTLTATPKPGYTFSAWVSDDVTFDGDTFTMPDNAVTVKATFAAADFTVTFDTDGGNAKEALPYKTTDETALGAAEKEGYNFTAWQVSVPAAEGDYNWGDTQTTYTAAQTVKGKYGNVTLKALWEGKEITVTYDAQGGASTSASKTVTVGSAYGTLAGAAREGYTFGGWFTDALEGTQVKADTVVTAKADHTIYAHWAINSYNLTVTSDGHGTASADPDTSVEYGKTVTLSAEANEGYTFLAWESSDVTVTGNTFNMPAKAVTVKATFSANSYTIAFNANFETEQTMEPVDATYDADVELPACTFERTGFAFLGWALTADAEAIDFEDGTTVSNLTAEAGGTVTLYAVWQDIQVELIAKEGSTTIIDEELGYIYGLKLNITLDELLNDYLDVVGNGRIEVVGAQLGTGTVIELYNENTGEKVCEYMMVIFGDTNGDGDINSSDVTDIRMMNAGLLETEPPTVYSFAADLNHDGSVNSTDVTAIRMLNAGVAEYDQVEREII